MVSASLSTAVPDSQTAYVKPLLKKPSLDFSLRELLPGVESPLLSKVARKSHDGEQSSRNRTNQQNHTTRDCITESVK